MSNGRRASILVQRPMYIAGMSDSAFTHPKPPPGTPAAALRQIRTVLLVVTIVACLGTTVELLLLGHYDDPWQFTPLVLLPLGAVVVGWYARRPGRVSLGALRLVMAMFFVSGAAGTLLHYLGNAEFARERTPDLRGVALFREAITGATPALAPGTMMLLGVLGLLYTVAARSDSRP